MEGLGGHPKWSARPGSEGSRESHRERKALPRRFVVVADATTCRTKPAADPCGHRFVVCRHMSKVTGSGVAQECQGCQNANVVVIFEEGRLGFVVIASQRSDGLSRFLGGRSFNSDIPPRRAAPTSRGAFSASLRFLPFAVVGSRLKSLFRLLFAI